MNFAVKSSYDNDQERFEALSPQAQEFLMNDFEPVRVQDQYNDSKIHYFKRENGKLLYLQAIEQAERTIKRDDGTSHTFPAFSTIYTRDEQGGYGWHTACDEEGLLDHGHGHWLIWFFEEMVKDAGNFVNVFRNQGRRTGRVLAVNFDTREALIKYFMPKGAVYMNVISWIGEQDSYEEGFHYIKDWRGQLVAKPIKYQRAPSGYYKAVSEKALSKKWQRLMDIQFWEVQDA
jgi:hypothetical protein